MSIIEVDHVVKRYRLGQTQTLRQSLSRLFTARGGDAAPRANSFNALDDVHFKVEAGEVLGIIGTNGAGKSTLLKVLSGITTPTTGRMTARGRIAPLIEVGAGLIGDLTGRENIYLNGVILGMSVKEIKKKFDAIVEFAELEQFIDTPIKRYSSGMAIRLGFAIATAVDADILIVDEVLAVGDIAFQRKCFDRIDDIVKKRGKTILLVSHNIRQVERLCTRTILLDHGRVLMDGDTREVCRQFYERTNTRVRENAAAAVALAAAAPAASRKASDPIELLGVDVLDVDGNATSVVPFRSDVVVQVRLRTTSPLRRPQFNIGVHTSDLLYLATHHSDRQLSVRTMNPGDYAVRCVFRRLQLTPGVYSLRFGIAEAEGSTSVFYAENIRHFQVSTVGGAEDAPVNSEGFFALDADWLDPQPIDSSRVELVAA